MTFTLSNSFSKRFTKLAPIKPAAPVTKTTLLSKLTLYVTIKLISLENVTSIYLLFHIIQTRIVAVGDDGLTYFLEFD